MKKHTILVLITALFVNTLSFSQNETRIGINVGGNFSKFRGNELIDEADADFGFLVGVSFEHALSEKLSLKANLNFERKTFKNSSNTIVDEFGMSIET